MEYQTYAIPAAAESAAVIDEKGIWVLRSQVEEILEERDGAIKEARHWESSHNQQVKLKRSSNARTSHAYRKVYGGLLGKIRKALGR